jgi:hypothetical protein
VDLDHLGQVPAPALQGSGVGGQQQQPLQGHPGLWSLPHHHSRCSSLHKGLQAHMGHVELYSW